MKRAAVLTICASVAIVAVALVAGRADAAPARSTGHDVDGHRGDVPVPAHLEVDPRARQGVRDQRHVLADRIGRRHRRRSRARTVDFGASDAPLSTVQLDACKGCVVDPVGALGHLDPLQPPGPQRPAPARRRRRSRTSTSARSRTGTTLRSRRSTRSSTLPDTKITPVYRSDGSGTTYNFTEYLSSRQPGLEGRRSASARASPGRRASARAAAPASPASSRSTTGALELRRRRLLAREQVPVRHDQEPRREVRDPGSPRDPAGRLDSCRTKITEPQPAQDRRSAGGGRPARLPDRRPSPT